MADMAALIDLTPFTPAHLDGLLALCVAERWPTFPSDPGRARSALLAPGSITMVATDSQTRTPIGFAHALTDGVTAYLAQLLVAPGYRCRGVGRSLVDATFARAGVARMDLLTDTAEGFYGKRAHRRYSGFRIYPPALTT
jgi:ribosomal protein S18 acetylase RimI-like enzyme